MQTSLPQTKLLKNSKDLNIWSHYLARASVGRKISDVGGRGTPGDRRERQGILRLKRMDMVLIAKVFGSVTSFGSGQNATH
jgi:hypothetical protein